MNKIPKIKNKGSLTDKTYQTLKSAILNLDLKPGELLIEEKLSEQLGVSRTPLRSALNKLSYEHLVSIIPGHGTYVTKLSLKDFKHIFDVRETIEILCIKLAAQNKTKEDIGKMENLIHEQICLLNQKNIDIKLFIHLDILFHSTIAHSTKNPILEKWTLQLVESYNRYLLATPFLDRAKIVTLEHKDILNAIKNGDEEKGSILIQNHIWDIRMSIQKNFIQEEFI